MGTIPQRIINLIKKTGEKCIVYNEDSQESYVIMDLEEYERLVLTRKSHSLTEPDQLDTIIRENRKKKNGIRPQREEPALSEQDKANELNKLQNSSLNSNASQNSSSLDRSVPTSVSKVQKEVTELLEDKQKDQPKSFSSIDEKDRYYFEPVEE